MEIIMQKYTEEEWQKKIAANVTDEMKKKGVSGYKLSKDTKMDMHGTYNFLNGKKMPTINRLIKCADLLGVHMSKFFKDRK